MITLYFEEKKKKYQIQVEKSEELLKRLDKFLKKNTIRIESIKDWSIDCSEEKSITSQRISQSILYALKFKN